MTKVSQAVVTDEEAGWRLDRWFKRHYPELRHPYLEKLLRTGQIRLDGCRAKAGERLSEGQTIRIPPISRAPVVEGYANKPLEKSVSEFDRKMLREAILYQDDEIIALNKPAGLAVQGGTGTKRHLDGMLEALQFDAKERPRLVHRLDRDTSGVLLLARTASAARYLTKAFQMKTTRKIYWAVVVGEPRPSQGKIDAPLVKLPGARGDEKVTVSESMGKNATTVYATADVAHKKAAWLMLWPITGRTHQLRVHCALMGTPILGDGKYGGEAAYPAGFETAKVHLHAREITIPQPSGKSLRIEAPLPSHMAETWKFFGFSPKINSEIFNEFT